MEETKQHTPIPEKHSFWGMLMMAGTLLLIYTYALLFSEGQNILLYVAKAGFFTGIALVIVGVVLTMQNRLETAAKFIYYPALLVGIMVTAIIQGRALPATLMVVIISAIGLLWVFPQQLRRHFLTAGVVALVIMWTLEWIDPSWRQPTQLAQAGPLGAAALVILFGIFMLSQSQGVISSSLRLRITVWTGIIMAVLALTLVGYSVITNRQTSIQNAENEVLAFASSQARQVRADTEIPLDVARTMAQSLTAVKNPAVNTTLTRDQVNAMLQQVLIENPSFLGTYTLWEPNAFDGQDQAYAGKPAHDATGRFIPYWVRADDGKIGVIALEQYETPGIGDWYILPRQTKKETTIAPLVYPINGVDTLMASFVVPIVHNGTFYGIAGVDAPITFVQQILDSVNLYNGTAEAALLTSSGTLIGVRNQPELANLPATEILPDFADLEARLTAGEAFISPSPDGKYLRAFAPVDIGRTNTHWSFALIIPLNEITAPATASAVRESVIGIVLIALAIAVLWFLSGQIVLPIRQLTTVANAVTKGDLNATAEIRSADETGILASAFNAMTSQIRGTLSTLEERVAERTRNLELAATVGRSVSEVRKLDVMLKNATELILSQFDLYYVQVYLTHPTQNSIVLQSGTGPVGAELVGRGHRLPINTGSINGRAVVEKRSIVIEDTAASPTFRPNPLLPDTRSEMAVPLLVGDKVVGVLDLQSHHPGALNEELVSAFEALAGQLAVAIQNASLLAETEQARAEVEAQARRLVRSNWDQHLDAIHQPEHTGFMFEGNKLVPIDEATDTEHENALTAPIAITGEPVGSLVVEIQSDQQSAQNVELVNIVARQVAQQLENLRLLDNAERYRREAEETARRNTIEGWKAYIESRSEKSLGYLYDSKEIRPVDKEPETPSLTLPIKARDESIGKLALLGVEQNEETLDLANAVAERLAAHIENLRLFEETRRGQMELDKRARELESVAEISSVSSRELDINNMLATVVHLTQRRFDLYHAHVFTYNEKANQLEIAACGWEEGAEQEGTHGTTAILLTQEQSLVARCAREKRAIVVNDVQSDPGWLPNPLLPDTRSEMAVPLLIGDQLLGVLDVQKDVINGFTEEDINVKSTLATQVATALQNARSFAQAQQQAEREAMLNTISQKIQSATTVEAVLQIAARELGHALGAPLTIAQLGVKERGNGH